ncbi:GntR family transcriptional regulator [Shouchella shacheensis]|uniref:GntR family transcriptional regulator n=1 Tax=Shouchella shacheensis TaxID=1649580 RepID=UPI00073FE86F|nr:GntR family transcriptional regulator [Shouchella shacheensis]
MPSLLPIQVDETSRTPIYDQIESQIKALIVSEQLPAGASLPSIRKLATSLSCSVITTRRSYQNLEQKGYIKTIQGKGTFVAEIDTVDQDTQKREAVSKALHHAVSVGKGYRYTNEELLKWFEAILKEADNND